LRERFERENARDHPPGRSGGEIQASKWNVRCGAEVFPMALKFSPRRRIFPHGAEKLLRSLKKLSVAEASGLGALSFSSCGKTEPQSAETVAKSSSILSVAVELSTKRWRFVRSTNHQARRAGILRGAVRWLSKASEPVAKCQIAAGSPKSAVRDNGNHQPAFRLGWAQDIFLHSTYESTTAGCFVYPSRCGGSRWRNGRAELSAT
jgi:hypothetical protein